MRHSYPIRAEPVEAPFFFFIPDQEERLLDKLRANGMKEATVDA